MPHLQRSRRGVSERGPELASARPERGPLGGLRELTRASDFDEEAGETGAGASSIRAVDPVDPAAFQSAIAPLFGAEALGLAVSGGSDSLALMHLAATALRPTGVRLELAVVDHGLRPESAQEAAAVRAKAAAYGLDAAILTWSGEKPSANLQAAAREARYALLTDWARERALPAIATGHTRDDVAETLLLRLARGSGVDGLAMMAASAPLDERCMLIRPLLGVDRAALRATCRAAGLDWIDDPTNDDPRFDRVKARRALEALAPLGLTRARLAATADRMSAARRVLERAAFDRFAASGALDALWGAAISRRALMYDPDEIGLRVLRDMLRAVSGAAYPPRLESLQGLLSAALGSTPLAPRSLHGCLIAAENGWVRVVREPSACASARRAEPGGALEWDGRWRVAAATSETGPLELGPLGAADGPSTRAPRRAPPPFDRVGRLDPPARAASPALRRAVAEGAAADRLLSAPALGLGCDQLAPIHGRRGGGAFCDDLLNAPRKPLFLELRQPGPTPEGD